MDDTPAPSPSTETPPPPLTTSEPAADPIATRPGKRKTRRWLLGLLAAIGALCAGSCGYVWGISVGIVPGIPGVFTVGDTPPPTPYPGEVLVHETFQGQFHWPSHKDATGSVEETGGQLRVETKTRAWDTIAFSSMAPEGSDYSIQQSIDLSGGPDISASWLRLGEIDATVEVKVQSDTGMAKYGAACRYTDGDNFYLFMIWSDGHYSIGKDIKGETTRLKDGSSSDINTGAASNRIRIVCSGSQLSLIVNGTTVATATDGQLKNGILALIAGAEYPDSPDTVVLFSDLAIRAP